MRFSETGLNSGSGWHRWDPHVHVPGTLFNDRYAEPNAWEQCLAAFEGTNPPIRAIGVTDYYLLDTYERMQSAKSDGRLQSCDLIFANVEMRLDVGTVKGNWANVHLLVSPYDPRHVFEVKRFLASLTFEALGDVLHCQSDDLIRLGKRANPSIQDDGAALRHGCSQFKVSFNQLRDLYKKSAWAQQNLLFGVAGGNDGPSGPRDAADSTLRQEIERFAQFIFASSPVQRDFWLGLSKLKPEQVKEHFGGLKPCLHGSDAHETAAIGNPAGNRFC